jgi:hypothetical protein
MIKSEVVKIKKIKDFDNLYIEQELIKLNKKSIRWAIIDITSDFLFVSISYVV